MNKKLTFMIEFIVCVFMSANLCIGGTRMVIQLPEVKFKGEISVEEAIKNRRSIREFKDEFLGLDDVSKLLWAAQEITGGYKRSAPSAGATYPLEVYLVVRKVKGLDTGLYHYMPRHHRLERMKTDSLQTALSKAALGQHCIKDASVNLIFTAVFERTTRKYHNRGYRYVYMEAGHAAQNVYLECESLRLGTVVIGAFIDEDVKKVLSLPKDEVPLYIMPIGETK